MYNHPCVIRPVYPLREGTGPPDDPMHHHPTPTPTTQGTSAPQPPTPDAKEWAVWAKQLAGWTAKWLVNRTDVWGQYLPLNQRSKGKAQTRKGKLTEDVLVRHFEGQDESDLIG